MQWEKRENLCINVVPLLSLHHSQLKMICRCFCVTLCVWLYFNQPNIFFPVSLSLTLHPTLSPSLCVFGLFTSPTRKTYIRLSINCILANEMRVKCTRELRTKSYETKSSKTGGNFKCREKIEIQSEKRSSEKCYFHSLLESITKLSVYFHSPNRAHL